MALIQIDSIPMVVVKSFLKSLKIHNKYQNVYPLISKSSFFNIWLSKIPHPNSETFHNVNSFQTLSDWLNHNVMPVKRLDLTDTQSFPTLYKYVTDLTNALIHYILEPQNIHPRQLGEIGQTTYNLSCRTILKDRYTEPEHDTRPISEITDPEELKSRLFQEFMAIRNSEDSDDFSRFIHHQMEQNHNVRRTFGVPDEISLDTIQPTMPW